MCLFVNIKRHPNGLPLISSKDLLVYKVLLHYKSGLTMTPFRYEEVNFVNGVAILEPKVSINSKEVEKRLQVTAGVIHAFISKVYPKLLLSKRFKKHRAIIPAHTQYYIGFADTCAAVDKMIIFKNIFYYWKYCFKNSFPLKAKKLY